MGLTPGASCYAGYEYTFLDDPGKVFHFDHYDHDGHIKIENMIMMIMLVMNIHS